MLYNGNNSDKLVVFIQKHLQFHGMTYTVNNNIVHISAYESSLSICPDNYVVIHNGCAKIIPRDVFELMYTKEQKHACVNMFEYELRRAVA